MPNPFTYDRPEELGERKRPFLEIGRVVSAVDDHTAYVVRTAETGSSSQGLVLASAVGDVCTPQEGDRVVLGRTHEGTTLVLGVVYPVGESPPQEAGVRRIGHKNTNSHVRIDSDGTINILASTTEEFDDTETPTVIVEPDGTVKLGESASAAVLTENATLEDTNGDPVTIVDTGSDNVQAS